MTNNTNKILTVAIAIAILLSIVILVYVNLPKQKTTPEETSQIETPILTVTYNGTQMNYSLADLEAFPSFTGTGSYIKVKTLPTVNINGPFEYTGVNITLLLDQILDLPSNYKIVVYSSDNYTTEYNFSQIHGDVAIYNTSGNVTGNSGVTLLLAYKETGQPITDATIGPLRLAYVDNGSITSSAFWAKMVVSIIVIKQ